MASRQERPLNFTADTKGQETSLLRKVNVPAAAVRRSSAAKESWRDVTLRSAGVHRDRRSAVSRPDSDVPSTPNATASYR
jgi:hypothetical protein